MADRANWTCSLMVWLNCLILVICSFLDAQFRKMPRSSIYACSGSNQLSACIQVILKPHCRYIILTCLNLYSMFFILLFLSILTVENTICQDMVYRNTMPLMCMRSQHRVTFLYLSMIPLDSFGTIMGSTWWTFWKTYVYWKFGTLVT